MIERLHRWIQSPDKISRVMTTLVIIAGGYTALQILLYCSRELRGRHRVESAWFVVAGVTLAAVWVNRQRAVVHLRDLSWPSHRSVPQITIAIVLAIALYWPALTLGLLADDFVALDRSVREILLPGNWQFYRPLPLGLWRLLFPAAGASGLHLVNIVLHGANAYLLFWLGRRAGASGCVAAVSGSVFLFFPAAVEAVAWNSGIFDVALVTLALVFLHVAVGRSHTGLALVAL